MRRLKAALLATPLALASIISLSQATDRLVPNIYGTIQAAINAAQPESADRVVITDDSNPFVPFVLDKSVSVLPNPGVAPVISGAGSPYAAQVTTSGAQIIGLTLQGGDSAVVRLSAGELTDCTLNDLGASFSRGLARLQGPVTLSNCVFNLTSTSSCRAVDVYNASGGSVEVSGCTFTSGRGSAGGGEFLIWVRAGSSGGVVRDNLIQFTDPANVGTAIVLNGGALVEDNEIRDPATGIVCAVGGLTVQRNIVDFTGSSGIELNGPGDVVQYNTVFRATGGAGSAGFRLTASPGTHDLANNLIAGPDYGLYYNGGTTDASVTHNICSGVATPSNRSFGADQLATKECLFCEARESTVEEFTQRIDSQAAPGNNGWDETVGARGVECAWGSLARSTTVPAGTQVTVLEDLTVPSGKSLTLGAGAALRFDDTDDSAGGNDSEKNELIVSGSLTTSGSSQYPVRLVSSRATPAEGDWYGIDARYATSLDLSRAEVRHGMYGLLAKAASGTNNVTNCTFGDNETYDIYCGQGGGAAPAITGNTIAVGGGFGIWLAGNFSGVTFSGNTLSGSTQSTAGIVCPSGTPTFSGNTVSYLRLGDGLRLSGGSPTLVQNVVQTCRAGVHVTGGSPVIGTTSSSSDNQLAYNLYGLHVEAAGCSFGPVTVRNNFINSNSHTGVMISGTNNVDLGTASQDGLNNLGYNTNWEVYNGSSCGTVLARGNYFGVCYDPPEPIRTYGAVDVTGFLCTPPAGRDVAVEPVPQTLLVRGLWPNPVRDVATVALTLGQAASELRLEVFDLNGRLIHRTVETNRPAGEQELSWDGTDRDGRPVPGGIYFVRVTLDRLHRAGLKALVVR